MKTKLAEKYLSMFEREGTGLKELYPELDEKIKEAVSDAFEKVVDSWELFGGSSEREDNVEEIEHKSRDGFRSSNDGGYDGVGFITLYYVQLETESLPPKAAKAVENMVEYNNGFVRQELLDKYPTELSKLPKNFSYNDLVEAGLDDIAEEFASASTDALNDDTVMFLVRAMYGHEGKDKGTFTIQGVVNWETPYHRSNSKYEDYYESEVEFNGDINKTVSKVKAELKKAVNHLGVAI